MPERPTSSSSTPAAFVCIEVLAPDAAAAERLAAEALEAGAEGLEEREEGEGIRLLLYAPAAAAQAVQRALAAASGGRMLIGAPAPVPETDWAEAWKEGLRAIEVSPRLRVRPSFVEAAARNGQAELLIDPGQAFGTGGHESTRLALEWVDQLAPQLGEGARILDVGGGTGVLALAALRLGRGRAVTLDLDPLAGPATRANARVNGLAHRLCTFTGPLEALAPGAFELVLANLLSREVLPLAPGLADHTAEGGHVVLSGLLVRERERVLATFAGVGLHPAGERIARDASGEAWLSLLMSR